MANEAKLEKLLVQLIRATTSRNLKWKMTPPPVVMRTATNDLVQDFLIAEYKGTKIAVFERRFESYDGEHDHTYWDSRSVFAFLSIGGLVTWETAEPAIQISQLLVAARESAANVDELIDDLLD